MDHKRKKSERNRKDTVLSIVEPALRRDFPLTYCWILQQFITWIVKMCTTLECFLWTSKNKKHLGHTSALRQHYCQAVNCREINWHSVEFLFPTDKFLFLKRLAQSYGIIVFALWTGPLWKGENASTKLQKSAVHFVCIAKRGFAHFSGNLAVSLMTSNHY